MRKKTRQVFLWWQWFCQLVEAILNCSCMLMMSV